MTKQQTPVATKALQPRGEFKLGLAEAEFVSEKRITLLEAIDATGSISQAAKQAGMSYKGAWDSLEQMNNLAQQPLLDRKVGGKQGGGTVLTNEGRQLVALYRRAAAVYAEYLAVLSDDMLNPEAFFTMERKLGMQISIRNQLLGKVSNMIEGAVNTEVALTLGNKDTVVAMITDKGAGQLSLQPGTEVIVLIKESAVFLAVGEQAPAVSARNCLRGVVDRIEEGAVNAEVVVRLAGGKNMVSNISNTGLKNLGLSEGSMVWACFKASDVMLATAR